MGLGPGAGVSGRQGPSPFRCTTPDPENSGGAPSPAQAPSRHSGPGELPSSFWAFGVRGASWSQHQAGPCSRKEGGRKEDSGLGKKQCGGDTHSVGKAGPNLAVSYFRTVPWGPQTRDTGGGESGCANAPNPHLMKLSAAPGLTRERKERKLDCLYSARVMGACCLSQVCGCWCGHMFMVCLEEHAGLQIRPVHGIWLSSV